MKFIEFNKCENFVIHWDFGELPMWFVSFIKPKLMSIWFSKSFTYNEAFSTENFHEDFSAQNNILENYSNYETAPH